MLIHIAASTDKRKEIDRGRCGKEFYYTPPSSYSRAIAHRSLPGQAGDLSEEKKKEGPHRTRAHSPAKPDGNFAVPFPIRWQSLSHPSIASGGSRISGGVFWIASGVSRNSGGVLRMGKDARRYGSGEKELSPQLSAGLQKEKINDISVRLFPKNHVPLSAREHHCVTHNLHIALNHEESICKPTFTHVGGCVHRTVATRLRLPHRPSS